jgi:hypothetical protein
MNSSAIPKNSASAANTAGRVVKKLSVSIGPRTANRAPGPAPPSGADATRISPPGRSRLLASLEIGILASPSSTVLATGSPSIITAVPSPVSSCTWRARAPAVSVESRTARASRCAS